MSDVVLVIGPPRAGVTAMAAELRRRMPLYRFAEASDMPQDEPAAVVFVASAVAPLVESDCTHLDSVADAGVVIGVVIGVVSKIDDHRDWRRVLSVNRELLGREVPWVGAAAAPRLGEPNVDELVNLLGAELGDPAVRSRNALRARTFRFAQLRDGREELVRRRRLAALDRAHALRGDVQQTRLVLMQSARRRCAALRTDLLDEAVTVSGRAVAGFPERVRQRCADVLADVDADVGAHTDETPAPSAFRIADPPLRSRRLENRLMTVLGAGFGFGVALVVTRFVAGLAPELAVAGLVAGGGVGLATAVWVIRARALLHVRAVLQTWAGDAVAGVRAAAEEKVAASMLAAESSMASDSAAAGIKEDAEFSRKIASIDDEFRQLGRSQKDPSLLPIGRSPGNGHLNRSCE